MSSRLSRIFLVVAVVLLASGCSTTRHVPDGSLLLDDVAIHVADSAGSERISTAELFNYLRQTPNHKVLGFAKLQLATYNLSGRDTTKWYNRWLRRIGQAPVIYNPDLTASSQRQLQLAMINKGYMNARVKVDTFPRPEKKKMTVAYNVIPGTPHRVSSMTYDIADSTVRRLIMADSAAFTLAPGSLLDRNLLDQERASIADRLRNRGYFSFSKDYITFLADTAENSFDVDLTMVINPPKPHRGSPATADTSAVHRRYRINRVVFVAEGTSVGAVPLKDLTVPCDTAYYGDISVIYPGGDRYIAPSILNEKCFLLPGSYYRAAAVDRTYEALAQLGIIKSVNIDLQPLPEVDGTARVDAIIYLTRNKKQNASLELEGTNSEGDFGFGIGLNYQHRDLGNRSNLLSTKFRVNYESLSGNLSDLINDRYTEYAGEVGITFPKFMFPFLSRGFKLRQKASTELAVSFNYQERPEYTRIIAGAAWKYKWGTRDNRERRTFDLIDINYVYLPESTIDFIDQIAPSNPLLRYSYEDHFIMRTGYTYSRTNRRILNSPLGRYNFQRRVYSLRASVETAGNILYAISSLDGQHRHDGVYKLFGIQYSQYAKAEFDYSVVYNLNPRHSIALHAGAGLGVPYGNSRVLPFEERFYAGGANGVRGWNVRTLGPGSFDSRNSVTDFINQCGDIRLDLSMEYRAKLFWVFEGAAFIDAGNIWTIHSYENQPGGMFRARTFWKEIAWSYGLGVRMDFNYFLLRFDLGIKAYNPATNQERWPLIHPRWKRDTAFHFAVGYPF